MKLLNLNDQVKAIRQIVALLSVGLMRLIQIDPATLIPTTVRAITSATISPSPNARGWNNSDATVNLISTSDPAGPNLQSITYSASGAQPMPRTTVNGSTALISITTEGVTLISYAATDINGCMEATKSVTVNLDKTSPTIVVDSSQPGSVYTSPFTPTLAIVDLDLQGTTDQASGEDSSRTTITLNGRPYSRGASITRWGDYTLVVVAIDYAGNSTTKKVQFRCRPPGALGLAYSYPLAIALFVLALVALLYSRFPLSTTVGLPTGQLWQDLTSTFLSIRSQTNFQVFGFVVFLSCCGVVALWKIPQRQLASSKADLRPEDFLKLKNDYRTTLAQIIGGVVVIIGLGFTWLQNATSQQTLEVTQRGQITARFTQAVDQLGASDKIGPAQIEIRVGAIYSLEQLASESPGDYGTIMDVLASDVRGNAAWGGSDTVSIVPATTQPRFDIQSALTVLGRRNYPIGTCGQELPDPGYTLNLSNTDLRGANLNNARLQRANLAGAHLEVANLAGARLDRADLTSAFLSQALLDKACMDYSILKYAHVEQAQLVDAYLEHADLTGAHLGDSLPERPSTPTSLFHADLTYATLIDADLRHANVEQATLVWAELNRAHLEQTDLRNAHLEHANLTGACLQGALLGGVTGLTLDQVRLAHYDGTTQWPDNLKGLVPIKPSSDSDICYHAGVALTG